jgi:microcystin-dependent protein
MGTPFIGQLLLASFNITPKGYLPCNGQLMTINQNQAMFSLLGTFYGGDGITSFGLPNLKGRTPVGFNGQFILGQTGGEETHTLTQPEVPTHSHQLMGTNSPAGSPDPPGNTFGTTTGNLTIYGPLSGPQAMNGATISNYGNSQGHENRQPFLVMNWLIATTGIFPTRN